MNLSKSRVESFLTCPRKYDLTYNQGITPISEAPQLVRGRLWHEALEAYWNADSDDESDAMSGAFANKGLDGAEIAVYGSHALAYCKRWEESDFPACEVISVEEEIRFDLGGHKVKSILDAVIETDEGVWIVESKTTSGDISRSSPYWGRLPLDVQIGLYLYAARSAGYSPAGVIYDVAKFLPLKLGKDGRTDILGETVKAFCERALKACLKQKEKLFVRAVIEAEDIDTEKACSNAIGVAKLIEAGSYPQNSRACWFRNGSCEFVNICYKSED